MNGVELHYQQIGDGDHALLLMPGALGESREGLIGALLTLSQSNTNKLLPFDIQLPQMTCAGCVYVILHK